MIYLMNDPCAITQLVKNGKRVRDIRKHSEFHFTPAVVKVKFEDGIEIQTDIGYLVADGGVTEIHETIKALDESYMEVPE